MKNNLFILHTQYNLILGVGVLKKYFSSDNNDLIIYPEFQLDEKWKEKLESLFTRVYYVREKFEPLKKGFDDVKEISSQFLSCRKFLRGKYDQIVISQDRYLENLIVQHLKKKNSSLVCSAVEEDVYYSLNDNRESVRAKSTAYVKPLLFKALTGVWKRPEYVVCYGSSSYVDTVYMIYPELVRKELNNKRIIELTKSEIQEGIKSLYLCDVSSTEKKMKVIIASDLLERYKNKDAVLKAFEIVKRWCDGKGVQLYIKYHPRENNKLDLGEDVVELPTRVAIEKLLMEENPENTVMVGNVSTALYISKKLGYRTLSVVGINGGNQIIQGVYEQMKILVPNNPNKINEMLEQAFIEMGLL